MEAKKKEKDIAEFMNRWYIKILPIRLKWKLFYKSKAWQKLATAVANNDNLTY